jgi:hypothetical protein
MDDLIGKVVRQLEEMRELWRGLLAAGLNAEPTRR